MNSIVVGICGGTASGKSYLSRELTDAFSPNATLLIQDDYYHDSSMLTLEEQNSKNYDHPQAIDLDLLYKNIKALKEGFSIEAPVYSFSSHSRLKEKKLIEPSPVIFLEGLFVFEKPEIRELLDLGVFLEVDDDIRFIRRMLRDIDERGRSIDSIVNQYLSTVKPMHDLFVDTASQHADIIIPSVNDDDIKKAVASIEEKVRQMQAGLTS